ncbi:MAG: polyribonucleotide nucleotidyltransferase [Candidatus Fermentibacteraceae bacterium]|nr:polyribonucleotide nucleotidyltransferase [Candidatus Fermentibacteraceae bacterium]MBN2608689.1 polyribonucleotide nucleotidyltransferase [Candidatus Fermentibacteraceae bacterium]
MRKVVEREIAGRTLTIETGRMAKQADGAVYVTYGGSAVLVAATSAGVRDLPFFPLTIEYRERTYAAGKIPGGFFKREGKPQEKEVLTARLIDRPLRPLFPSEYLEETQIYILVLSSDNENDPSLLGMLGASASLMISDIPWSGPVSSVKIGRIEGQFVVNPTMEQQEQSELDLVVAVKGTDVVMLEGSSDQLSEDEVMQAIKLASMEAAKINELQLELQKLAGREKRSFEPILEKPATLQDDVNDIAMPEFEKVYGNGVKNALSEAGDRARETALEKLAGRYPGFEEADKLDRIIGIAISEAEMQFARRKLLVEKKRHDGRAQEDVRQITCEVGVLPRPHGSALFTRGETQALVAVTLGGARDEQRIDALMGEYTKDFMLHYNFPSFSVGEVKPARGPGRREIGHGHLAEMALSHVMPKNKEDFAYTVRIVSDVLESNGSSSQATICGGSLSLMDAGVPVTDAVAGVALGLVTDGKDYRILSDIAGVEDHLGDMDLKIAGTSRGITAIQMDLKVEGISLDILREAMERARENRLHILGEMNKVISEPRPELSQYAPRVYTVHIDKDMIGKLIGPGGKNIRAITEETGADINIEDDGTVVVLSDDAAAADRAIEMIELSAGKPKVGQIYEGVVAKIMNFGAFVEIMPGTDGLVHISQISKTRVDKVEDVLKRGQRVRVKVIDVKDDGKVDLTMKDVDQK